MQKSHRTQWIISAGVTAAILVFLVIKVDWSACLLEFRKVKLPYIPLLMALLLVPVGMRAFRWRLLLPAETSFSTGRLFEACVAGLLATFLLPLRAGELVRPWTLSRWERVTFPTALASVFVERIFDLVTLLLLLAVTLPHATSIPPVVLTAARTFGALALILLFLVVFVCWRPDIATRWGHRVVGVFEKRSPRMAARASGLVDDVVRGLAAVSTVGRLVRVLLWSAGIWLATAVWFQMALWAFGEFPSLWVGMLITVTVALAIAVPSAPGFLGTYQAGCLLALSTMYTCSREFAVAYSVVTHALQIVTVLVAGLVVLQREGLRFGQLGRRPEPNGETTLPSSQT
jgi:glycosyltransferase 2 family protein